MPPLVQPLHLARSAPGFLVLAPFSRTDPVTPLEERRSALRRVRPRCCEDLATLNRVRPGAGQATPAIVPNKGMSQLRDLTTLMGAALTAALTPTRRRSVLMQGYVDALPEWAGERCVPMNQSTLEGGTVVSLLTCCSITSAARTAPDSPRSASAQAALHWCTVSDASSRPSWVAARSAR